VGSATFTSVVTGKKQIMHDKQYVKFTAVTRLAVMCAAGGLGLTAFGVAGLLNAIRGGPVLAILTLVVAAGIFALAGYFVWGIRWLKERPGLMREAAEQQNAGKRHSQGT
jgi:hypothetical protein